MEADLYEKILNLKRNNQYSAEISKNERRNFRRFCTNYSFKDGILYYMDRQVITADRKQLLII